jgi:hypothetical protein
MLEDPLNELLFSAASLWEIVIKRGLGRSNFQVDARVLRRGLLDNGYQENWLLLLRHAQHTPTGLSSISSDISRQPHPAAAFERRNGVRCIRVRSAHIGFALRPAR